MYCFIIYIILQLVIENKRGGVRKIRIGKKSIQWRKSWIILYGRKRGNINIEGIKVNKGGIWYDMIKSKPKMIVAFLLMSAILMMSIQTSMATEKDIMSNDVIKQAFDKTWIK